MKKNPESQIMEQENRERNFIRERESFKAGHLDDIYTQKLEQGRNDLIRWQQDMEDELELMIHRLRGEAFVNGDWKEVSKPLCGEKFINQVIIPQCHPFLSRNIINTRFDERMILDTLKITLYSIVDAMADLYYQNEIEFANLDLVVNEIKNVITPAPFRALQGFTKKIDSSSIKRIEAFNEQMQDQQKKGLFS